MWRLLALALVACKGAADPCSDAVDDSFARKHAQRQTEAREHPDRRDALLDAQRADDRGAARRRALLVKHCVDDEWTADQRACLAKGDDTCLDVGRQAVLDAERLDDPVVAQQGFVDRMCVCRDRACASRVDQTRTTWSAENPRPSDTPELTALRTRYDACMTRAMRVHEAPPATALPPACVRYIRMLEGLARCEAMPQASRDSLRQGIDTMKSGWNFADLPSDARKTAMDAAGSACDQGAKAIDQSAAGAGCPDPLTN